MSHHLYKPYVSGDQSSPKGQYGQSEKDLWRVPHHSHPGSSFSSSEVSSAASYNLGGTMPPTSLQPESYKPEQRRAGLNEDIERSAVHFHISIARERTRHQPVGNNVYMSSPQRDKFLSSSEEMTSHSASSTFQRHGLTDSDSSSLDWLSICKTPIREDSSKISPTSASSSYRNSGGRQFYASSERQRDVQAFPGLGDDNDPVPGKTMPPKESQQPKYTPEVAVNILQKFGLGKEDLKYLLSYPEDQITSDNLPLILRQICVQKEKQTSKRDQSKSATEVQPTLSSIDKPSKVIDYGHTSKYTLDGDDTGKSGRVDSGRSGSLSELGSHHSSSKEPQQKSTLERKNSSSISSGDQMGSVSCLSLARNYVAPSRSDPTKQQQTQSNQTSKRHLTHSSIVQKDTRDLKTKAAEYLSLNETEPDCQRRSKTKPSNSETHEGNSCSDNSIAKRHYPEVVEHMEVKRLHRSPQEEREKPWQPEEKEKSEQQSPYQKAQEEPEHQPISFQMGQAFQPHFFPASNSVPPPYFIPGFVAPPATSRLTPGLIGYPPPPPSWQFLAKGPVYSGPTQAMMNDYASTPPVMFPHVCTLCNIVFPTMRDWLPHQNTNGHLENCKLLRERFPHWDGTADLFLGAPDKDVEPSPSTSAQSWSYVHENIQHERRSRSHSPRRYSRSKRRRETSSSSSRSRSHSPRWRPSSSGSDSGSHSPSYSPRRHRTKSTSRSRSRNCSSSPRRQRGSKSKRVKRSSRSGSKYSSRRSRSPFSSHRSRSRSYERESSSRREEEKRFSPKRSSERRPVSGRSTSQRRTSSSAERLLETSGLLTPEVAKKKSRSSSSSSKKLPKVRNDHSDSEEEELPPPTMVKLTGVHQTLTQSKVLAAVEILGKTTSVILYRSKEEANVHFEKEEDADNLRSLKNLYIDGIPVKIVTEKPAGAVKTPPTSTEKQMKSPQQKSAELILSTPKTNESTSRGKIETPVSSSPAGNQTKAETVSCDSAEPVKVAASKPTAEAVDDPETSLTVGEMVETHLSPQSLRVFGKNKNKMKSIIHKCTKTLVLISNLPKYTDGLYKEKDVADLLRPFGFQHGRDPIYVIPQKGLAIVTLPNAKCVQKLVNNTSNGIRFNQSTLCLKPLNNKISMTWFGFYKSLMKLMHVKVTDDGTRTVYIEDISLEETKELREALRKVVSVKNFLPLLNKLYVEFESVEDADQLGLSYNLCKKDCAHTVYRLCIPRAPILTPAGKCDLSLGSTPPFWVTMKARPYMFPIVSPWWSNPTYLTANTLEDVEKANMSKADKFHTVMLTGFPNQIYTHEHVAELVWPFLADKTLHTLFTNVVVLPLQKRAFVYFSNWTSCYDFVINHITKPVSLEGTPLRVHFVLQTMGRECNEVFYSHCIEFSLACSMMRARSASAFVRVTVYRNMMKLSNCEIPDPTSLESRMLSVEISVAFVDLIVMVMDAVASIASFVNYLPFANRIYIEMSSSSDVTKVLERFHCLTLPVKFRSDVIRIEHLNSLQRRLRIFGDMLVQPITAMPKRTNSHLQNSAPSTASFKVQGRTLCPGESCTQKKKKIKKRGRKGRIRSFCCSALAKLENHTEDP